MEIEEMIKRTNMYHTSFEICISSHALVTMKPPLSFKKLNYCDKYSQSRNRCL